MEKIKIAIVGLGGVGGYFGGMLAKHYESNHHVKIHFFARGAHMDAIKQNGLQVLHGDIRILAKPESISDSANEIGVADLVLLSTKSFSLESALQQIKALVNRDTIILPLLNGVDSKEIIQKYYPDNCILDGCAYIVSRIKEPGTIVNSGNIQTLYFGNAENKDERLVRFEKIFRDAGIEATLSPQILKTVWEKFIFISPTATATSFFDHSIGEILSHPNELESVQKLIQEIILLAKHKNIIVSENIAEQTLQKLKSLPFQTTSSMHSDFIQKKKENELESLCGYVVKEAEKINLALPEYLKLYQVLKNR